MNKSKGLLIGIIAGIVFTIAISAISVDVYSNSQAVSILSQEGTVNISSTGFEYTSKKEILSSMELKSLARLSNHYYIITVNSVAGNLNDMELYEWREYGKRAGIDMNNLFKHED
jgi:hypothetical protein